MERLDSSQQTHSVTELEDQKTPVLTQEVTSITSTDTNSDINKPVARSKRHVQPLTILGVLLGAGAIAAGIYGYRWWQYTSQKYPQTDNAYITANIYPVTARVPGIVTDVTVNDNQVVSPGTVLVKLDPRDYQVSLTQAKASLELAKQQAALARENLNVVATNTDVPKPTPANKNTPTPAPNRDKILQTQTLNQQKEINQQQYKTAQAAIAQKQAEVKTSELQLSYTNITALAPGKIGNKNVSVGQRVQPGQTLFTVVQPGAWIVANFRETQLEKIQPGQKVAIKIPAFPSQKFRGKVDSMSPTSFGKVDVPQDNPTPNVIKNQDVQRIPVKIVFEPESIRGYESRFTPGMSASVTVETK